MFCPNCGTQNADNVTFCAGCGSKLAADQPAQQPVSETPVYEAPAQAPTYEAPAQPQQPVYQQPVYQTPAQPQQPAYQQPYQPAYQQPPVVPGKGMGIAGMVLGIIALVFGCCTEYVSIPCAVIGLILSIVAMSKAKKAGMKNGCAVAGLVCCCISLALAVIGYILAATVFAGLMDEVYNELGQDIYSFY